MGPDRAVFCFTSPDVLEAPPSCGLVAVPDLVAAVDRWASHHATAEPAVLTLDLTQVEAWEMSVLRPLVWARRRCQSVGADAVLVLPARTLFRPNEIAVLRQLFSCLDPHTAVVDTAGPPTSSAAPT